MQTVNTLLVLWAIGFVFSSLFWGISDRISTNRSYSIGRPIVLSMIWPAVLIVVVIGLVFYIPYNVGMNLVDFVREKHEAKK